MRVCHPTACMHTSARACRHGGGAPTGYAMHAQAKSHGQCQLPLQ